MKSSTWLLAAAGLAAVGATVYFGFFYDPHKTAEEEIAPSPVLSTEAGTETAAEEGETVNTGLFGSEPLQLTDVNTFDYLTDEEVVQTLLDPVLTPATVSPPIAGVPNSNDEQGQETLSEPLPSMVEQPAPDLFETAQGSGLLSEEDLAREAEDPSLMTPEALAVIATVEGALREAVMRRDVQAFLSALDEGFQYSHDRGTPQNPDDDFLIQGDDVYQEIVMNRLFRPDDNEAIVEMSRPRDFQMADNVAVISYDYGMAFRGQTGARQSVGSAQIYVTRARDGSDAWRIIGWSDGPYRPPAPPTPTETE